MEAEQANNKLDKLMQGDNYDIAFKCRTDYIPSVCDSVCIKPARVLMNDCTGAPVPRWQANTNPEGAIAASFIIIGIFITIVLIANINWSKSK